MFDDYKMNYAINRAVSLQIKSNILNDYLVVGQLVWSILSLDNSIGSECISF